ncbi:MAG: ankyrin repeat domain-containing protein [Planctomycetota bacterium]
MAFVSRSAAEPPLLLRAVADGDTARMLRLIRDADDTRTVIDAENEFGITALSVACDNGDELAVTALLASGADPKQTTRGGEPILMSAARQGNRKIVRLLIECGADPNRKEPGGQNALMWAAAAGNLGAVEALLDGGAKVMTSTEGGFDAWFFAARHGRTNVLGCLLQKGLAVNRVMQHKKTGGRRPRRAMSALLLALESGHFDTADWLLQNGADPNDQRSGFAPLHALSWVRRPSRGDNPQGDPPPRTSGRISSLQFARRLLDAGADVDLALENGKAGDAHFVPKGATPLIYASFTNDLPLMRLLVENGADVNATKDDGSTPLLAASGIGIFVADEYPGTENETVAAVEFLLEHGADIHATTKKKESVMHGAAYRSFAILVQQLAAAGADPKVCNQKNHRGGRPMDIAKGRRPGSFKPNRKTQAAIADWLQTVP